MRGDASTNNSSHREYKGKRSELAGALRRAAAWVRRRGRFLRRVLERDVLDVLLLARARLLRRRGRWADHPTGARARRGRLGSAGNGTSRRRRGRRGQDADVVDVVARFAGVLHIRSYVELVGVRLHLALSLRVRRRFRRAVADEADVLVDRLSLNYADWYNMCWSNNDLTLIRS